MHLNTSAKTDVRHEARLVPLSFRNVSSKCITILGIWYNANYAGSLCTVRVAHLTEVPFAWKELTAEALHIR